MTTSEWIRIGFAVATLGSSVFCLWMAVLIHRINGMRLKIMAERINLLEEICNNHFDQIGERLNQLGGTDWPDGADETGEYDDSTPFLAGAMNDIVARLQNGSVLRWVTAEAAGGDWDPRERKLYLDKEELPFNSVNACSVQELQTRGVLEARDENGCTYLELAEPWKK